MKTVLLAALVASASAFQTGFMPSTSSGMRLRAANAMPKANVARRSLAIAPRMAFDMEALIQKSKDDRLKHLEEQAMESIRTAVEQDNGNAVFPNAMIAGDCVITDLCARLGYLENGKVKIMVVDTFHLFPETMEFLSDLEKHYKFKAEVFQAVGCADKAEYDKKFGADLWKEDVEQYDKVCKVEPFQRGLKTLQTGVMLNGRRRDHGDERAYIDLYENAPIGGGMAKVNPLAYWTFEDCFDYIAKYKIPIHPLHAKGYPSIGDAKDTVPVPLDGSVKFVNYKFEGKKSEWLDYNAERKGRFVGLANKDGSTKTECGIHVAGAEQTFDRDLWVDGSKVAELSKPDAEKLTKGGDDAVVVVYAPWCQFCQKLEPEFEELAKSLGSTKVYKYRGDEDRDFVSANYNTKSFPTINVVKGGKAIKYESEDRSVAAMKKFVEDNIKVAA
jgi:phosphoadenylyl-sulfate reductase (thioredoxin)